MTNNCSFNNPDGRIYHCYDPYCPEHGERNRTESPWNGLPNLKAPFSMIVCSTRDGHREDRMRIQREIANLTEAKKLDRSGRD